MGHRIFGTFMCLLLVGIGTLLLYFGIKQVDVGFITIGVLDLSVGLCVAWFLDLKEVVPYE